MEKNNKKSKISYETLWKFIIRPPRDSYTEDFLGQPIFMFKGKTFLRKDYIIKWRIYNEMLIFWAWRRISFKKNNSNKEILKREINLFVEIFLELVYLKENLYLEYHESHDVIILVDFISKLPGVGCIGI